jgi:simple sugar transport system permease protein
VADPASSPGLAAPASLSGRPASGRLATVAAGVVRAAIVVTGGGVVGVLLLGLLGKSPWTAGRVAFETVLTSRAGLVDALLLAAPLLLIALGYSLAFRAGVWTVGGEGQLHLGAVGAGIVALTMPPTVPPAVGVPLATAAGVLAGTLWGLVPGWLHAYRRVNVVVSTLMLNFVGVLLMNALIRTVFRDPGLPLMQTAPFPPAFRLPAAGEGRLHVGVLVAILVVPLFAYLAGRTVLGHRIRAIGANPDASRASGIDVARTTLTLVLISGALAGLAGATYALGVAHRLRADLAPDLGYTAVPVALLARCRPLGVPATAFFFAALTVAAEAIQVELDVPSDFMLVLTGALVLFTLGADEVLRRRSGAP